jgi:hypothetical protein
MVIKIDELKEKKLVFDHGEIINDYLKKRVVGSE